MSVHSCRLAAVALGLSLIAAAALPRNATAKAVQPMNVRCVDVKDAKPERIGVHTLLLQTERVRFDPPSDYRTKSLGLQLLDERRGKVVALEVPIGQLRASFGPILEGGPDTKNRKGALLDNFFVDVVSISDDGKTLGLSVRGSAADGGAQTSLVFWTVGSGRVVVAKQVFRRARKEKATFTVLGHDAMGELITVESRKIEAGSGRHVLDLVLSRISPATAKATTVWKGRTPPRRNDRMGVGSRFAFSEDRKRVAIPEYLEDPDGEAAVHVVDLMTGKHREFPALATTYGVAFSPIGDKLALGSNRLGVVRLLDLESGKVEHEAKGFKRIHKLVFGAGGTFLYVASKAGDIQQLLGFTLAPMPNPGAWKAKKLLGGTLYAEIPASSDPQHQPFGRTADKQGFGKLDRICTISM
ncbi:MAG: hypothetical protein H6747_12955 [Deltaproteobacteria bacterium]|nr:hypothetical protein [Deltaproteobacteria bacterium]